MNLKDIWACKLVDTCGLHQYISAIYMCGNSYYAKSVEHKTVEQVIYRGSIDAR